MITEKYADHIPLHRQERRLARQGVELSRSTLCDWMAGAARTLEPLYDLMKTLILLCGTIHTDDTSVKVRDSERKIKATGRLWIYFGDHLHPYNVFDFTMSRKRDGPSRFLKGFRGYLQADAFSGYDGIYAGGGVVEVGLQRARAAQVRRGAEDGPVAGGRGAGLLSPALCDREGDQGGDRQAARGRDRRIRRGPRFGCGSARNGRCRFWSAFETWLEAQKPDVLPKSPMGGAIGYVQNHWEALIRYTSSGYLSIDNNVSEQHMKTIATGRKNWLFTGSENGGKTMAMLFSVVSSCQRHGHDPFVYLRDVLARLPDHPKDRLEDLLPTRWSPAVASATTSEPVGPNGAPSVD